MRSRYNSLITEEFRLDEESLIRFYMKIRTNTKFSFEVGTLKSNNHYILKFTALYYDDFGLSQNKLYRHYLITNDERRRLARDIELLQDEDIKHCITDEECENFINHLRS